MCEVMHNTLYIVKLDHDHVAVNKVAVNCTTYMYGIVLGVLVITYNCLD